MRNSLHRLAQAVRHRQRIPNHVVVIGGGIGGLTTAALLAKAGLSVTVLEAHIYPGGCAGTFYHQGYRFDAGATLAGGFYPGGPMHKLAETLALGAFERETDSSGRRAENLDSADIWGAVPSPIALSVHLPKQGTHEDCLTITRYGDARRWEERRRAFGAASFPFWQWQECTADLLWDLALRLPPWPPQSVGETGTLLRKGIGWGFSQWQSLLDPRLGLAAQAFQPLATRLEGASDMLRQFVDGQLLIAAQTTAHAANALYGAAALDLPRRGIAHPRGGIGTLAEKLVQVIRAYGGEVHYRAEVSAIHLENGLPTAVHTKRKEEYPADLVIANLTPWNLAQLMGEDMPSRLRHLPEQPQRGWGAFMLYAGIDDAMLRTHGLRMGRSHEHSGYEAPADEILHHQIIAQEPLGEGNSVFVSISPAHDRTRAPDGKRAVTISTHTDMKAWWTLYQNEPERYEAHKAAYTERVLDVVEQVWPGCRAAVDLLLPGTPITFNRFTRRAQGWVGGYPQTSLFPTWGPRIAPNLWMVGDSIFPGQSVAAVALGGMRVADSILREFGEHAFSTILRNTQLPQQPAALNEATYKTRFTSARRTQSRDTA